MEIGQWRYNATSHFGLFFVCLSFTNLLLGVNGETLGVRRFIEKSFRVVRGTRSEKR